jgi:hypothetical protein
MQALVSRQEIVPYARPASSFSGSIISAPNVHWNPNSRYGKLRGHRFRSHGCVVGIPEKWPNGRVRLKLSGSQIRP